MRTTRVLLALNKYFEFGGLQRDMVRIARELNKRGAETCILVGAWEGDIPADLTVEVVPLKALTNHGTVEALSAEVASRRAHYDAVIGFVKMPHCDFYFGGDHCFKERVLTEIAAWKRWLPRYQKFLKLEAAVFGEASKTEAFLIAPQQKAAYQRQWQTPDERCHLLPGGLNKAFFDQHPVNEADVQALRVELNIAPDDKVLLHVGSDFKRKGVERILLAVAALPPVLRDHTQLVVVGSGDSTAMMALAQQTGIAARVHFTGGRRDVPRFYAMAHCLVHPATIEVAGMILLEALYNGVPVLCTEVCGYSAHVAAADAGILVPVPFNQQTMNAKLELMLNTERHAQWCDNGRRYCAVEPVTGMIESIAVRVLSSCSER